MSHKRSKKQQGRITTGPMDHIWRVAQGRTGGAWVRAASILKHELDGNPKRAKKLIVRERNANNGKRRVWRKRGRPTLKIVKASIVVKGGQVRKVSPVAQAAS